jgi:hypothetical protein
MAAKAKLPAAVPAAAAAAADSDDEDDAPALLMPASIARKAAKKPAADLDLFGLGKCQVAILATVLTLAAEAAPEVKLPPAPKLQPPTISAAPAVADFVPPPPTAADAYPGYYQLPSGSWAAYDPAYYSSFFDNSAAHAAEAEAQKKERTGREWAELDDGRATVVDYDVSTGLAAGRKERERVAMAQATRPKYADDYEYTEIGKTKGLAAEKHQLTSLLSSAYSQREELEARIAQNKKNMRAAGTKYGEFGAKLRGWLLTDRFLSWWLFCSVMYTRSCTCVCWSLY